MAQELPVCHSSRLAASPPLACLLLAPPLPLPTLLALLPPPLPVLLRLRAGSDLGQRRQGLPRCAGVVGVAALFGVYAAQAAQPLRVGGIQAPVARPFLQQVEIAADRGGEGRGE